MQWGEPKMDDDSSNNSDAKRDGKNEGAKTVDGHDDHLREHGINPYIISWDPSAFDASEWDSDRIREYQRLMEENRDEAEETYNLACTQLNTLIAISGIILSIIVSCMYASDGSCTYLIVMSSCFIASSLMISAYSSLKTRYVFATYPSGIQIFTRSRSLEQQMIAGINLTLGITKSHSDFAGMKRKALDYAMVLFIIGIGLLISELIVQTFFL